MIDIRALSKRYGSTTVLDDFTLEVPDGESVALWGPNGAGKTTVVRCILGLVRYEGSIEVNGVDAARSPKAARHLIGHVAQELNFYDDLTLIETIEFSARLRSISLDRVTEVLDLVQLTEHGSKRIRELSGGMKQRAGIALALLADPPVLLLDEPTSSLDVSARERMVDVLEALRDDKRSVILTSHDLDEVGMLVDRVVAMEDGRMIQECAPSELAERLGLHAWLHLIVGSGQREGAIAALNANGFEARSNTSGVLVEVSAQQKGAALGTLQDNGFDVVDFEVWR